LVWLVLTGPSDGRQMKLAEMNHAARNLGANEWWDAVTGADEYGDVVTTFMHKRWGMALQVPPNLPKSSLQIRCSTAPCHPALLQKNTYVVVKYLGDHVLCCCKMVRGFVPAPLGGPAAMLRTTIGDCGAHL